MRNPLNHKAETPNDKCETLRPQMINADQVVEFRQIAKLVREVDELVVREHQIREVRQQPDLRWKLRDLCVSSTALCQHKSVQHGSMSAQVCSTRDRVSTSVPITGPCQHQRAQHGIVAARVCPTQRVCVNHRTVYVSTRFVRFVSSPISAGSFVICVCPAPHFVSTLSALCQHKSVQNGTVSEPVRPGRGRVNTSVSSTTRACPTQPVCVNRRSVYVSTRSVRFVG